MLSCLRRDGPANFTRRVAEDTITDRVGGSGICQVVPGVSVGYWLVTIVERRPTR